LLRLAIAPLGGDSLGEKKEQEKKTSPFFCFFL